VSESAVSAEEAAGREVDRADLLEAFLVGLDARLGRWEDVADEYRSGCDTVGRRVRVELAGGELVGTAVAVAADGRLVVRTDEGDSVPVSAGDVTHLRTMR
jgi:BirA family transcriptional regulator, biotin operon repressor / biotin---[acetyl-CoA-carboxylase] ligase